MNEPTVHLGTAIRDVVAGVELQNVELFDERLRLRSPLRTAGNVIEVRDVVQVRVDTTVGGRARTGWGEAAPLQWWGSEILAHARYDLGRLRDAVQAGRQLHGLEAMAMMRPPTARFALESALLDAAAQARGVPLRRMFGANPPNDVLLNATIGLTDSCEAFDAARQAVQDGFDVIKVKVGDTVQADLARVEAVRRAAPGATLRLDANGAWSEAEAIGCIERLAGDDVEYVEQPVPAGELEALQNVAAVATVPIAADESCLPLERAQCLLERRTVDVLVLKPSLLGAWSDVMEVVAMAAETGIGVVFTSAIDSGINRAVVAQFATLLPGGRACGLATGGWIANDAAWEEFVGEGRLYLGSGNGIGFRPPAGGTK